MTTRFFIATRRLLVNASRRILRARWWAILEFAGLALLIALGLAWTRIPEKYASQVSLTLLVPVVIAACFVLLQAGTIRSLLRPIMGERESSRAFVSLGWGAATLLLWIAAGWILWSFIDSFDDHVVLWAGYLNSRFNAGARSHFATYNHFVMWLGCVGWTLRWVAIPGLLLPLGSSAALGLRRIPWKRVTRVSVNWRWWPCVLLLALVGEAWPQTFFDAMPHGTFHEQVLRVTLRVTAAYLLAVVAWVKALAWAVTLLTDTKADGNDGTEAAAEPALVSPRSGPSDSVRPPLPSTEQDFGRNA